MRQKTQALAIARSGMLALLGSAVFQLSGQDPSQIQLLTRNQVLSIITDATKIQEAEGTWTGFIYQDRKWAAREVSITKSGMSPSLGFTFLVRGIPGLNKNTRMIRFGDGIPQWCLEKGIGAPIKAKAALKGELEGSTYEISFAKYSDPTSIPPSTIVFNVSGHKQTVQCQRGVDSASLIWVGDIDFDGKPDFLLFTSDDNGGWQETLYLSTKARPGELLGVATSQEYQPDM